MKKRIYLHLLMVGLVCILITALVCAFAYWQSAKKQTLFDLQKSASVVGEEMAYTTTPYEYLERTAKSADGIRITWISPDGQVRFDSEESPSNMANHKFRPEVEQALRYGRGTDSRNSDTLDKITLYAALKLQDGSILRMARAQQDLFRPLAQLLPWWVITLLILMFICQITVQHLTRDLLDPLNQATRYLSQIGHDKNVITDEVFHTTYEELQPFLMAINRQGKQLDHNLRQLQQERNSMKVITDNLQEGVLLLDDQLRIQWINSWGMQVLQPVELPFREQLMGKFVMPLLPPEGRYPSNQLLDQDVHSWYMKYNGRQYQLVLRPLDPPQERSSRMLIIMDITETREREQLRRDFTANVTHELKTPLTSISGFAELMAAGLYQKKDDITHFGKLICQESKRLLEMINNIIFLSRIEGVPAGSLRESVPLGKLIQSIVDFMAPVCCDRQVTIHCSLIADPVLGSSSLLREMAMNLIDNGVKYNRQGGHVYITMKRENQKIILTVRDTGIGIPDAVQGRVFERFYRVDESRAKSSGGSGLGLSIVKHIVEQHQGTITLQSRVNEGTTIVVTLPAAE